MDMGATCTAQGAGAATLSAFWHLFLKSCTSFSLVLLLEYRPAHPLTAPAPPGAIILVRIFRGSSTERLTFSKYCVVKDGFVLFRCRSNQPGGLLIQPEFGATVQLQDRTFVTLSLTMQKMQALPDIIINLRHDFRNDKNSPFHDPDWEDNVRSMIVSVQGLDQKLQTTVSAYENYVGKLLAATTGGTINILKDGEFENVVVSEDHVNRPDGSQVRRLISDFRKLDHVHVPDKNDSTPAEDRTYDGISTVDCTVGRMEEGDAALTAPE